MLTVPPAEHTMIVDRLRGAGCVFCEDEAAVLIESATSGEHLQAMIDQRVHGLPLEHVVGWAEFAGLRIVVDVGVFVPRRRTELLVELARRMTPRDGVVVDLCCGSGAVGVAIAAAAGRIELVAVDIESAAVRCARANVEVFGGTVFQGDLFDALPASLQGRVDVLVCNAPYVPENEIEVLPREARLHEPMITLSGGSDGLDVQRRVVGAAGAWLAPDGLLLIETSEHQASATRALFENAGFATTIEHDDELDATVVVGGTSIVSTTAAVRARVRRGS